MSDIPSEILREIFHRAPVESLLRFKVVCKAWRRIIDDPSFIVALTSNLHYSSIPLLIKNTIGHCFFSLPLDSVLSVSLDSFKNFGHGCSSQTIEATPIETLSHHMSDYSRNFLPVGSCNGLILFSRIYKKKTSMVIWSPLTRYLHNLPYIDSNSYTFSLGLGYDYCAHDYKVVRIGKLCHKENSLYRTFVYSLKLDSWRVINDFPVDFRCWSDHGVFLNGSLHWWSGDMIIVLDLGTENYSQLPPPPQPCEGLYMNLSVLGGCLVLNYYYSMNHLIVWVMREYGVETSWTKLFSLQKFDNSFSLGILKPVAYLESQGQVLLQQDSNFYLLDIDKNYAKKVTIQGLTDHVFLRVCPKSPFQLQESHHVSTSVPRLKLSVTTTDLQFHLGSSNWLSEGED